MVREVIGGMRKFGQEVVVHFVHDGHNFFVGDSEVQISNDAAKEQLNFPELVVFRRKVVIQATVLDGRHSRKIHECETAIGIFSEKYQIKTFELVLRNRPEKCSSARKAVAHGI